MNPPSEVRIGGYRYKVIQEIDAGDFDGTHRRGKGTLAVRSFPSPDREREVMVHELLHAIRANGGHDTTQHDTGEERRLYDQAEEKFITSVEWGLVEVLRANPQLVAYLTSHD